MTTLWAGGRKGMMMAAAAMTKTIADRQARTEMQAMTAASEYGSSFSEEISAGLLAQSIGGGGGNGGLNVSIEIQIPEEKSCF